MLIEVTVEEAEELVEGLEQALVELEADPHETTWRATDAIHELLRRLEPPCTEDETA